MAMAFGVLGTVIDGITIDEPDVVTKSWPSFWEMIEGLRR
jgi:3-phosphoshikimate 1-carboxyvinyltransferase